MGDPRGDRSFWRARGPGLPWAGAAIGVSHLVRSTRTGASSGFALFGVAIPANVFERPAFSFGPRRAAATGTSLLEGCRRRGTGAGMWIYPRFGILLSAAFAAACLHLLLFETSGG